MIRRLTLTVFTLSLALAPMAAADAVTIVELDDGAEIIDDDRVPRGLARCPTTTEEKLGFDEPACVKGGTDERGYPLHTVCLYDTWFPLWTGGEVFCMTTEHWAYLPAPGACVDVLEMHRPTACANGADCMLRVGPARFVCEADAS